MAQFESDVKNAFSGLLDALSNENISRINQSAIKGLEGKMKNRIFIQGKAEDGGPIGSYSPLYADFRARNGLDTSFVNLRFTGALQDSFVTSKGSGNSWQLGFNDGEEEDIAGYNEDHFGRDIFSPSEDEIDYVTDVIATALANALNSTK